MHHGPLRGLIVLCAVALLWAGVAAIRTRSRPDAGAGHDLELRLGAKSWVALREAARRARAQGARDELGRQWVRGTLVADGAAYPCKVRLRGDTADHWSEERMSYRVRLTGEARWRGGRDFNLIVAWDRGYVLEACAAWWSERLGLLPVPSRLVRVRRNGEDQGFYVLQEELGPDLLERLGRPATQLLRAVPWLGQGREELTDPRLLYSLPAFAFEGDPLPTDGAVSRVLEEALRILREPSSIGPTELARLSHVLDLDRFAAHNAVCRLLGSHPEMPHNACLFFDGSRGLFEPVLLDPSMRTRTLADLEAPDGEVALFSSRLLEAPAFRERRDAALRRVLEHGPDFLRFVAGLERLAPLLATDRDLLGPWALGQQGQRIDARGFAAFVHALDASYRENLGVIAAYLDGATAPLPPPPPRGRTTRRHLVHVTHVGDTAVVRHSAPTALTLRAAGADHRLPPDHDTRLELASGAPLAAFDPADPARPVDIREAACTEVGVTLRHLGAGELEALAAAAGLTLLAREDRLVVPAGQHLIQRPLVLPRGRRVVVEAGAILRFAPGASLVLWSPLEVRGAPERPVFMDEAEPGRGWGVVAVHDAGGESRVEHLVFARSRGATLNGIAYTGGLCFYGSDAVVTASKFVDAGADDALNVKAARVEVRGCVFDRCPSDAIDLDWCEGLVAGCVFLSPAGDGVDLSGARDVEVTANIVLGAGDKGVSVGEASRARVSENLVARCALGIASKDLSRVESRDNVLVATGVALTAYRKKPIFGGGSLSSRCDLVIAAGEEAQADAHSRIDRAEVAPMRRDLIGADVTLEDEAALAALARRAQASLAAAAATLEAAAAWRRAQGPP